MRWPSEWNDPSYLELLKGTVINCLLIEPQQNLEAVAERAWQIGLEVGTSASLPKDVTLVPGEWPGIRSTRTGATDQASAGPTGAPWVDSSCWKVRLAAMLHPGNAVWVDANPVEPRLFSESYVLGVVDAAVYGGRWIIALDKQLTAGITAQKDKAVETWKKVTGTAGFFAAHQAWSNFTGEAVLGVISNFVGENEFLGTELLNLLARTNQQYRILLRDQMSQESFGGLRAILYCDAQPPAPELRKQILAFVKEGGTLISGPNWGSPSGTPASEEGYPGYSHWVWGSGKLALSKDDLSDPFLIAQDATLLMSHRYDVLHFWNGGAINRRYTQCQQTGHAGKCSARLPLAWRALIFSGPHSAARLTRRPHESPSPDARPTHLLNSSPS